MKKPNFEVFRCTKNFKKTWIPVRIVFSSDFIYPSNRCILRMNQLNSTGTELNPDAFIPNEGISDLSIYKQTTGGFVKMTIKVLRGREASQFFLQETSRRMSLVQFNAMYETELEFPINVEYSDSTAILEPHIPRRIKSNLGKAVPKLLLPPASSNSAVYFVPIDPNSRENLSLNSYLKSSDITHSIPTDSEGFVGRQLFNTLPSLQPKLQKAAADYIAECMLGRPKIAVLAITNSEFELTHLAHEPEGKSVETVLRSAIKGKSPSPQSKISPRVHWNPPLTTLPEIDDSSSPSSGSLQSLRSKIRPSSAPSTWKLYYMACAAPLGKWGMLVVLLGLIGVTLATQGTVVFYGATSMVVTGAAALGISIFKHRKNCRREPLSINQERSSSEGFVPSPS